jgi:hypothetical protein
MRWVVSVSPLEGGLRGVTWIVNQKIFVNPFKEIVTLDPSPLEGGLRGVTWIVNKKICGNTF